MSSGSRSAASSFLWVCLWLCWGVFLVQQTADLARDSAPWPLWLVRALPLIIFMPGVARDQLRSLVWLCFVILFYFVSAVELVFARPTDTLAIIGICVVVLLFVVSTFYIRVRGRELRQHSNTEPPALDP